jgi:hypothetical protein
MKLLQSRMGLPITANGWYRHCFTALIADSVSKQFPSHDQLVEIARFDPLCYMKEFPSRGLQAHGEPDNCRI